MSHRSRRIRALKKRKRLINMLRPEFQPLAHRLNAAGKIAMGYIWGSKILASVYYVPTIQYEWDDQTGDPIPGTDILILPRSAL